MVPFALLPPPRRLALISDLSGEECLRRLAEATDPRRFSLFSLSGYAGSKDVLSKIKGRRVELGKRKYYRNDFAPIFYGEVKPWGSGTRIEGYFDVRPSVRLFTTAWLVMVIVIVSVFFLSALGKIMDGSRPPTEDTYLALVAGPGLVLFFVVLTRFTRWLARGEEQFLADFLQRTLVARVEYPWLSADAANAPE